jgi:two-component system, OmpR family, sensor kinase
MGRWFWKFFSYAWLAQLASIACGSLLFRTYFAPPGESGWLPLNALNALPMLIALVTSLALAALLAWHFAKPIRALREAFTAAESGNLDVHLDPVVTARRDELAELGRHFERMAARLREVLDGQRRLLHDVSHEMRSPLARLQAAIGLARQQPDKLEEHLKRMELEAVRIDALVEELLTLARLQSGIGVEADQQVYLVDVANSVVEDSDFEARLEGGQVRLDAGANCRVRGNPELLHRAIENIVRNAVRHGGDGGAVAVDLREVAGSARLLVLDDGPGVAPEFMARIFEPFERPPNVAGTQASGYGLGLTIARRIVEAHGGTIKAANRSEGGLSVEVTLPLAMQSPTLPGAGSPRGQE